MTSCVGYCDTTSLLVGVLALCFSPKAAASSTPHQRRLAISVSSGLCFASRYIRGWWREWPKARRAMATFLLWPDPFSTQQKCCWWRQDAHVLVSTRALATEELLASCSKVHKLCVLHHTAMSIVEDVEKLIWEVERRPPLCKKKNEWKNTVTEIWRIIYGTKFTNQSSRTGVNFQLNRNQKNVC